MLAGLMQVMDLHVDNCGLNHYSELYDEEKYNVWNENIRPVFTQ